MKKASIIIPAHNSEKTIKQTIRSITSQNFFNNKDYELIVVDDGSTDNTSEIANSLGAKVILGSHGGPSEARNLGVSSSKGKILIFIDSDCIAENGWLKWITEGFSEKSVGAVGGPYSKNDLSEDFSTQFLNTEMNWRFSNIKRKYVSGHGSYNLAVRRSVFLQVGGFNKNYNQHATEDWEFTSRIVEAGHKILFERNATVMHHHRIKFSKYLKKQFYKGKWRVFFYSSKQGRSKRKDEYTGKTIALQIALAGLSLVFLPLTYFSNLFFYFFLFLMDLLFLTNLPLGSYTYNKYNSYKKSILFISAQVLRIYFLFFGVVTGVTTGVIKKCIKRN